MATYVVVGMVDKYVRPVADVACFLCKTGFSDLESAKKSTEKEFSRMRRTWTTLRASTCIQGGRWLREEWVEDNSSHWWRDGVIDEGTVKFDIYKLASNDGEADVYTYIGGATYLG